MRIRVAGFKHPESDKALVYREVKQLETLHLVMKKAVKEKGANLFSVRILPDKEKKVDIDKLKFVKASPEMLELLRSALDIEDKDMVCRYCKENLLGKKYGILPGNTDKSIITCDSPLCISEYLTEHEKENEK